MGGLVGHQHGPIRPEKLGAERLVLHFVPKVVLVPEPRGELARVAGLRCVVRYERERAMERPVNQDVPFGSSVLWKTPL